MAKLRSYIDRSFEAYHRYLGMRDSVEIGEMERLCIDRHYRDLKKSKYHIDENKVAAVFVTFSKFRHWIGSKFAGKQFELTDWQAFCLYNLFGWVDDAGLRRFRDAYIQVARKNGKTSFAAGIGVHLLAFDGEPGSQVYVAATKRDQAMICFNDAVRYITSSDALSDVIDTFRDSIYVAEDGSVMAPLGANYNKMDGLNVHGAVMDELHQHPTGDLWDVIQYGMGAREQPLMLGITTAGASKFSFCFQKRAYAEKVLKRKIEDESLFIYVTEPDKDDEVGDTTTWRKGNPSLGVTVTLEALQDDYKKAQGMPVKLNNFARYRLDRWVVGGADNWVNPQLWERVPGREPPPEGVECYLGLDLASREDIAALVVFFPEYRCFMPFFWLPEENIEDKQAVYEVPLTEWVRGGHLIATEGNVIDFAVIGAKIKDIGNRYAVKEVAYDDWNATQLANSLSEHYEMVPLPQTTKTYNEPMQIVERWLMDPKSGICKVANPVLDWMFENTHVREDNEGRKKPIKKDGTVRYKIDGVVAMLMAVNRAELIEEDQVKVGVFGDNYSCV